MSSPLSDAKIAELSALIFRGQKIAAIKLYRELTGFGLKEAKDEVDALEVKLRAESPEKFSAVPTRAGCFGTAAALGFGGLALVWWLTRA